MEDIQLRHRSGVCRFLPLEQYKAQIAVLRKIGFIAQEQRRICGGLAAFG